jgi:hypothetical protein
VHLKGGCRLYCYQNCFFKVLVSKHHKGNTVKCGHKYTLSPATPLGVGVRFQRCCTMPDIHNQNLLTVSRKFRLLVSCSAGDCLVVH